MSDKLLILRPEVAREDIEQGGCSSDSCPIARALARLGMTDVCVGYPSITFRWNQTLYSAATSLRLRNWIENADSARRNKRPLPIPIRLRIKLPNPTP